MIRTELLVNAGVAQSKNEILDTMFGQINMYNMQASRIALFQRQGQGPAAKTGQFADSERINLLDRILQAAGTWLTSKPPTGTPKNTARWDAMSDLANQVVREGAALNAKFLRGPADWRTISADASLQSYWLEALAPGHQTGYELSPLFQKWVKKGIDKGRTYSFWHYIGATKTKTGANKQPRAGATAVTYSTAQRAEQYRLHFVGGRLHYVHDDTPFDTQALETHFSGTGWAIFVVSPEGKLYAGSHVVGQFHHSTFLAGSAVVAAGEIVADDGDLKIITPKSGHYGPTAENIRNMLTLLNDIPDDVVVLPKFARVLKAYTAGDFRASPAPARELKRGEVTAAMPNWAQSAQANAAVFDKIPA